MQAFVAAGGVVLLSGGSGAEFLGFEDVYPDQSLVSTPVVTHRVVTPSPIVDGVTEITISALEDEIAFGPEHVALFSQTGQQPLVTTAVIGAGRVVWLAAPTPFMNEHIAKVDNLQLLLNVAGQPGERQVLWDEHYHGNTRSLWSYAVNTPLPWMGAQIGLILGSAVFAFGRRRAPVRPRVDVPRTSSLEFIEMLGGLYRRSKAASAAMSVARARFLRAATSVCGVSPDRGDEAVARAVGARLAIDAGPVLRALTVSRDASATANLAGNAATDLTRQLQTFTTQLYALRKMRRPAPTGGQES